MVVRQLLDGFLNLFLRYARLELRYDYGVHGVAMLYPRDMNNSRNK